MSIIVRQPHRRIRLPRLLDRTDAVIVQRIVVLFVIGAALFVAGTVVLGVGIHFVRTLGGI